MATESCGLPMVNCNFHFIGDDLSVTYKTDDVLD